LWPTIGANNNGSTTTTFVCQQINRKCVLPNIDVRHRSGSCDDRSHDFRTGSVTARVDNPLLAVTTFAAECPISIFTIKLGSPANQFLDSLGGLSDHHVYDRLVAKIPPRRQRVIYVMLEAIVGIQNTGDSSLRIRAVGLPQNVLRDDERGKVWINRIGSSQARNTAAYHQNVGESVEGTTRIEWQ
jgi:hypothetical protein